MREFRATPPKIQAPQIGACAPADRGISDYTDDVCDTLWRDLDGAGAAVLVRNVDAWRLEGCDFGGSLWRGVNCGDVIFDCCDFSNATFDACGMHRVRFVRCKFTGTVWSDCFCSQVQWTDCVGDMASWDRVKCRDIRMEESKFVRFSLHNCTLTRLGCARNDWSGLQLSSTDLRGVDLSDTALDGISADTPSRLSGCRVSTAGAAAIARMWGIDVH